MCIDQNFQVSCYWVTANRLGRSQSTMPRSESELGCDGRLVAKLVISNWPVSSDHCCDQAGGVSWCSLTGDCCTTSVSQLRDTGMGVNVNTEENSIRSKFPFKAADKTAGLPRSRATSERRAQRSLSNTSSDWVCCVLCPQICIGHLPAQLALVLGPAWQRVARLRHVTQFYSLHLIFYYLYPTQHAEQLCLCSAVI